MSIWGIDLGGTKIECAVLKNADDPTVLIRERLDTEASNGYNHILNQIERLVNQISEKIGESPQKIGFSTPGAIDPISGTMKNSNTTCLNGQPLHTDLEKKLGIPIKMANDANCFALAEAKMGSVPDKMPEAKIVFGVILGSGVGGGVVVNGEVINGRQGIGGEWGHNFLDESGGDCYCGQVGCVERVLSGKNLERYHLETFGEDKKLKVIYQEYLDKTNPNSTATIERMIHFFGKAITVVINILDPDVIVLGGGVGNIDALYTLGVEEARKHVFNPRLDTLFLKPKLGDSAGVFGAAFLVA